MDITDILNSDLDKASPDVRQLVLTIIRNYESNSGVSPYTHWNVILNKTACGFKTFEGSSWDSSDPTTMGRVLSIPLANLIGAVLYDVHCCFPLLLTSATKPTTLNDLINGYGIPYSEINNYDQYILPTFTQLDVNSYQIDYKLDKPIIIGDYGMDEGLPYGINSANSLLPDFTTFEYSLFAITGV